MVDVMRCYANLHWHRRKIEAALNVKPSNRANHAPRPRRQSQRRLKPNEILSLVSDYEEGARINELAAKYKVHRVTIIDNLERQHVAMRRGVVERRFPEAALLYEQGWSLAKIGEHMGVSTGTVWLALKKHGVTMRDTHGRRG